MTGFCTLFFAFFSYITLALASYQTILTESMSSSQGVTIQGTSTSAFTGTTANVAGDFNGDGIDDFLIADCYKNAETGWVYVIFGRTEGLEDLTVASGLSPSQGFIIKGAGATRFGAGVSSVGDVNGDGIDDIIVAAVRVGQVYVIYGRRGEGEDILITSDFASSGQGFLLHSSVIDMFHTTTVNGAGDVNGDGIGDIMIGMPSDTSSTGIVYVIYGSKDPSSSVIELSTSLDPLQGFWIQGPGTSSLFGAQIYPAGDVNGDSIDDIIISATGTSAGTVYIIYGKSTTRAGFSISSSVDYDTISGISAGSLFGSPISIAGDINGDGFADMVIGASGESGGTSFAISGSENGFSGVSVATSARVSAITTSQSTMSCFQGLGVGDMNGDGLADVTVRCAPTTSGSASTTVYVVYGSVEGVSTQTLPDALDSGSSLGYAISSGDTSNVLTVFGSGDFNNDYLEDLLLLGNPGVMYSTVSIIYGSSKIIEGLKITCF